MSMRHSQAEKKAMRDLQEKMALHRDITKYKFVPAALLGKDELDKDGESILKAKTKQKRAKPKAEPKKQKTDSKKKK